jgi:hypothetical protein
VPASCANLQPGAVVAAGPPRPVVHAQRFIRGRACTDRNAPPPQAAPDPVLPPEDRFGPPDERPHQDRKKPKHPNAAPTKAPAPDDANDLAPARPDGTDFRQDMDVYPGGVVRPAHAVRADRSAVRQALRPVVDPTPPPVVMMAPQQAGPGQGVPPGTNADVVTPPNPNPAPTIHALLPQQEPQSAAAAQPSDLPFCDQVAALPDTGSHSRFYLRTGVLLTGAGAALVAAAVYVRRRISDPQWYLND